MSRRVSFTAALLAPVLAALAVAATLASPVADVQPAAAQSQNRAAVIVHTGGGSTAVCVRFEEPTITGLDALQRAGLGAVVQSFSGQGAAVCGINGVGCPADSSCLTCQAPNYWAYHQAGPGAGGFSFSGVGAGSTQVSDGSVEGWQWGTGGQPPFQTVDQVCGAVNPPAPPPRSPAPIPGGSSGSNGGPGGTGSSGEPGAIPDFRSATTAPVTATTVDDPTTTTGPGEDEDSADSGDGSDVDAELAATASTDSGGGGGPWAVALFVALIAAVGTGAVIVRRRSAV